MITGYSINSITKANDSTYVSTYQISRLLSLPQILSQCSQIVVHQNTTPASAYQNLHVFLTHSGNSGFHHQAICLFPSEIARLTRVFCQPVLTGRHWSDLRFPGSFLPDASAGRVEHAKYELSDFVRSDLFQSSTCRLGVACWIHANNFQPFSSLP